MAPERFTGGRVGPARRCLLAGMSALRMPDRVATLPHRRAESADGLSHHVAATAAECDSTKLGTAFDAVVTRGMAKQPEDRFSSAGDLARAANAAATAAQVPTAINPMPPVVTRQFAPTPPPPPRPQSPPARKGFGVGQWLLAGAAFGVFAALLGLVLWLVLGQNKSEPAPGGPDRDRHADNSADVDVTRSDCGGPAGHRCTGLHRLSRGAMR